MDKLHNSGSDDLIHLSCYQIQGCVGGLEAISAVIRQERKSHQPVAGFYYLENPPKKTLKLNLKTTETTAQRRSFSHAGPKPHVYF